MKNLLLEIKELAQKGMEKAVISHDEENKNTFLSIMLKTEIAISKLNENKHGLDLQSSKEEISRTYEKIDEDIKSNMYLVAYCFSKYEHNSLYPTLSQDKAFIVASEKLGVKKNTLKNARDWFDGHCDNHRSGWWQQPLPDDMQKFKDIYDNKSRNEIIGEAMSVLDIQAEEPCENESFGRHLKNTKYHGKFLNKQEVEEFIKTVTEESPTVAKDLVEQCSQRTFNACCDSFSKIYNEPVENLVSEIVKCDPRTVSNSNFSLWIRARFIQEIFKRNLAEEALKV
jgi:hypothetical protein